MNIYIYVYICIYVYIYVYMYIYVFDFAGNRRNRIFSATCHISETNTGVDFISQCYIHTYTTIFIGQCYIHTYTTIGVFKYIYMVICTCVYIYICMYIHVNICMHRSRTSSNAHGCGEIFSGVSCNTMQHTATHCQQQYISVPPPMPTGAANTVTRKHMMIWIQSFQSSGHTGCIRP